MGIFNSYVSLPEGNECLFPHSYDDNRFCMKTSPSWIASQILPVGFGMMDVRDHCSHEAWFANGLHQKKQQVSGYINQKHSPGMRPSWPTMEHTTTWRWNQQIVMALVMAKPIESIVNVHPFKALPGPESTGVQVRSPQASTGHVALRIIFSISTRWT